MSKEVLSENRTKGKCEEKYKYEESDYVNGGQEQDEMCFPSVDFNDVAVCYKEIGIQECVIAYSSGRRA